MDLGHLRNVGIFAHIDAGKTTLTERILVLSGRERRVGRVDDGTAVMDWMPEERERGITITAAATRVVWGDTALNVIDTPGHVDFTFEVERSLRALDGAVLVIDAVVGVQAQTETIWRQLERASVPTIAVINKCDRLGADPLSAAESLRKRLGIEPLPVAYPWIDEEGQLIGVLDIVGRRAWREVSLASETGASASMAGANEAEGRRREPIPAALSDEVEVLHAELIEALASRDEELLDVVASGRTPSTVELMKSLRRATLARELVPVFVAAALRGIGTEAVLDGVVAYLPSPLDSLGARLGGLDLPPPDPDASPIAYAFKVQSTRHTDLVFVRLFAGRVAPGARLWNTRLGAFELVHDVCRMHADTSERIEVAEAGDIIVLAGLRGAATGDVLVGSEEAAQALAGAFGPLRAPEPVLALVVEPADADERERLGQALVRLAREDPSFQAAEDPVSGQWMARGMGELHLEVTLGRLGREFGLHPRVGRPRVTFREVLTTVAQGRGVIERALGGRDGYAEVEVEVAPLGQPDPDTAEAAEAADHAGAHRGPADRIPIDRARVEFAADATVPEARRSALASALEVEARSGPRFGLPLAGVTIRVLGGATRPGHDVEAVWIQAGVAALREALREALAVGGITVHEPLAEVVIETPEAFSSGIIGDLGARSALVGEVESTAGWRRIHARAPFAELFGYATALRSLSQGRAVASIVPAGSTRVAEEALRTRGLA